MKKAKRAVALILAVVTLILLCSCEEYQYASKVTDKKPTETPTDAPESTGPTMNDDPTDDFVVHVTVNGEPYSPRMDMDVYWNDGNSVHTAPLNENGEARIDGLDGNYRVTLSAVPNEYTYDPNSCVTTNDQRSVTLELYPLKFLSGSGTGIYDCYKFSGTGVYCAVINKPGDAIFFEYAPASEGVYTIESWIDTMEDSVNPYIDVYVGSTQWKAYEKTTDDGGPVGSYTINFVHSVQILDEQISSGGQAVYTFAVRAESKYNQYPITVTFAVKRNNEIEPTPLLPSANYGMAISTFDFSTYNVADHNYGNEYSVKYPEYAFEGKENTYVFDQKLVKLWKKSDGGDNFYHIYDEEKYASTGGYGPILYANITTKNRFIDRAFTEIEYRGATEVINNALAVGGYNYKHFIEGHTKLTTFGNINGGSFYCIDTCPCHDKNVSVKDWFCTEDCTNCKSGCRKCPEELVGFEGYQAYANSDGAVAVTEELKEFLYNYANSPRAQLFRDGDGYIDGRGWLGKYYQAPTGSEWLFGCFYYEK